MHFLNGQDCDPTAYIAPFPIWQPLSRRHRRLWTASLGCSCHFQTRPYRYPNPTGRRARSTRINSLPLLSLFPSFIVTAKKLKIKLKLELKIGGEGQTCCQRTVVCGRLLERLFDNARAASFICPRTDQKGASEIRDGWMGGW